MPSGATATAGRTEPTLLELDGADDREAAGKAGRVVRREHRDRDAERRGEEQREPRDLERGRADAAAGEGDEREAGGEAGDTAEDGPDRAEHARLDDDHPRDRRPPGDRDDPAIAASASKRPKTW